MEIKIQNVLECSKTFLVSYLDFFVLTCAVTFFHVLHHMDPFILL